MKKLSRSFLLGLSIVGTLTGATLLAGCSGTQQPTGPGGFNNGLLTEGVQAQAQVFTQVEELARPAINEGLFLSNNFLNAFNATLPANEGAALAGNAALAGQATTVIGAVATAGGDAERVSDVVAALIPDVLRIDTSLVVDGGDASPIGTAAYIAGAAVCENGVFLNAESGNGVAGTRTIPVLVPRNGRKLEDDVVADTLVELAGNAAFANGDISIGSNVFYNDTDSPAGATHQALNDQTSPEGTNENTSGLAGNNEGGAAVFPFLAPPN
jgi:hypothetical protein